MPNRNDQMNFHDLNQDEDDIVRNFNQLISKNQYFNSEDEALNVLWICLQKRLEGGDKIIVNDRIIDLSNPRKEVPFDQQLLFCLLKRNVAALYQYSDPNSPIEKAFLSLFMIHVMVNYFFAIIIEPYITDTNQTPEDYMEKRRGGYEKTMEIHRLYQERVGKTSNKDFLEFLKNASFPEQEKKDYIDYFLLWHCCKMKDAYIVTLQAQFNDMRILGSRARPDMLIWVPSLPKLKYIVECDGYNYHKGRKPFVTDRMRMGAFQDRGYQYRAFSGLEIYHNGFRASSTLLDSLQKKREELEQQ